MSLAFTLGKKQKSKSEIIKPLREVFFNNFKDEEGLKRNAKSRADILSIRFVDVFEALYQIYEIQ